MTPALEGVDVVFHLAAMAGLIKSWTDFDLYNSCNLTATQRLLEAVRKNSKLRRFVYVSTSSVYGLYSSGDEQLPTRPGSPYGVDQAGERTPLPIVRSPGPSTCGVALLFHLRSASASGYQFFKFIDAMLKGQTIAVFGDGQQARGNTYIDDCVEATVRAVDAAQGRLIMWAVARRRRYGKFYIVSKRSLA